MAGDMLWEQSGPIYVMFIIRQAIDIVKNKINI